MYPTGVLIQEEALLMKEKMIETNPELTDFMLLTGGLINNVRDTTDNNRYIRGGWLYTHNNGQSMDGKTFRIRKRLFT